MGPGDLNKALCGLPEFKHPNLLRGLEDMDNAGVYQLSGRLAIIQHLDYFTPIVDDPYIFGQIAVANALSDIYAMGGKPLTALNVVCFPSKSMDIGVLNEILKGGANKMLEAGVLLVGGHSVEDTEPKYGISVTGVVHPKKLVTNGGAKPGDKLILTKPLGTGIISTALKAGAADKKSVEQSIKSMTALNAKASELMQETGVHACTDITGFGLIGHGVQMAENSGIGMVLQWKALPLLPKAEEYAKQGFCPGGTKRNFDYYKGCSLLDKDLPAHARDILFDPQTSGGLLISVSARKAGRLLARLHEAGISEAAIIGEVTAEPAGKVVVR